MEFKLTLALPRDELSIPVVRRILTRTLDVLGVARSCTEDIEVAITEACTNVLDHAASGDEYEVSAGIDEDICVIEIVDTGRGFHSDQVGHADADPGAEQGRGIQLIRALMDSARFETRVESGTVVHLEKQLSWHEGAPVRRLASNSATHSGPWARQEQITPATERDQPLG